MARRSTSTKAATGGASATGGSAGGQNGDNAPQSLRHAQQRPSERRGRPPAFTDADKQAAFLAYVAGDSAAEIGARLGCSARTIRDWVTKGGWKTRLQAARETVQGLEAQILRLTRATNPTTAQAHRLAMLTRSLDRLRKSAPAPKPRPTVANAVSVEALARVLDPDYGLYRYQTEFLQSEERFRVICKARQIGFSYVVGLAVLLGALAGRPQIVVSASERQAQIILNYVRAHAGRLEVLLDEDKANEITIGGAKIVAVSTNFRTAQGWPGDVWFDEFAWVRNQRALWAAVVPAITAIGGRVTVFSTPFTPGSLFWELATNHKGRHDQWRRWTITLEDAIAQGMPMEPGGLEELRGLFDSESWAMFYQCQWAEDGAALLSWSLLHELTRETIQPAHFARLHGGVDVGRINDRTAIALIGQEHARGDWLDRYALVHHESLKGAAFDAQRATILAVDQRYEVARWGVDRTGIGMQLAEELSGVSSRFEGVWFSAQRKARLALNLLKLAEDKRLMLPNDPDLLAQLHAVKKQVSGQTIRYDAERTDDGHADLFWAVAIAAEDRAGGAGGNGFGVEVL